MSDFLSMGGYGAYVWSAFGFAAVLMVALLWHSITAARGRQVELEELRQRVRPRREARTKPLRPRRAEDAGQQA